MAAIFSERAKFSRWLEIELLEIEAVRQHDVVAFVENVRDNVGGAGRHIHFGLTSSDVLDTATAVALRDAGDLLVEGIGRLTQSVKSLAFDHRNTLMAGRTHGVHAEPTTFGVKLAGWAFELARDRDRLRGARDQVAVGKLSGAV